jgi:hypothetical protein
MRSRAILTGLGFAALLGGAGCGGVALPGAPHGAVAGASGNCADLFASAMATREAVKGSWGCLSPAIQDQFRTVGLDGDAGVAKLAAKDPVYTHDKYLGRLEDGAYVYSLSGQAGASVLLVWLDQAGKVADVRTGGRSTG